MFSQEGTYITSFDITTNKFDNKGSDEIKGRLIYFIIFLFFTKNKLIIEK